MFKRVALAAVASAFSLTLAGQAHAFDWSDTEISYWYGWQFKEPGFAQDAIQHNIDLTHADGYKYGSNFFSLNFTKWGHNVPASSIDSATDFSSNTGASEFYGVYRTVLSGNKISNTTTFSFGPIKDVGLEIGGDLDSENSTFATGKYLFVTGPQFAINIPKGFWNVSLVFGHEWGNNGYAGHSMSFDAQAILETAWLYPIQVGPLPLKFAGFMNILSPKGKDASGNQTRTEILAHPKLLVDVSELVAGVPDKVDAGVGFEYWKNKFGNSPSVLSGTEQKAVFFEAGYHF